MSISKADQQVLDAEIAQVTAQIARLEKRRIELTRRRNESPPISQLPSELLAIIFSYCTSTLGDEDLRFITGQPNCNTAAKDAARIRSAYDNLPFPDILRICHVNHAWRSLVLGSPHLWTRIEVQTHTRPEIVSYMNSLAGSQPIQLVYVGKPHWVGELHSPRVLTALQDIVHRNFGNIQSFTLCCDLELAMHLLFHAVGDAEKLEILALSLTDQSSNFKNICTFKMPNLRRISLERITLPWNSPAFTSSPHLTHVDLSYAERYSPEKVADLRQFLSRSPKLVSLCFTLRFFGLQGLDDLELVLTRSGLPLDISLPNLQVLSIHSFDLATLSAVLFGIHVPKDISRLVLSAEVQTKSSPNTISAAEQLHGRICQIVACERDPEDYVAPEELEIHSDWAKCLYLCPNGATGTTKVSVLTPRVYNPSNHTTAFQLPWSYKGLKSITIGLPSSAVPETLWPVLARLKRLEMIQMSGERPHAFLNNLRMSGGGTPDDLPLEHPGDESHDAINCPFPALRVIRFTSVTEGFRWCVKKGKDPSAFRATQYFRTLFRAILLALRGRPGDILEELAFVSCGQWFRQAEDAGLRTLFEITKVVRWEEDTKLTPGHASAREHASLLLDEDMLEVQPDAAFEA